MTELASLDTLAAYWKSCEELKHAPEYERIAEIFVEGVRAEQERYLLLSAQHARLCDKVYEGDGETLKLVAAESRLAELEAGRAASDRSVHAALDAADEQYRLRQAAVAEMEGMRELLRDARNCITQLASIREGTQYKVASGAMIDRIDSALAARAAREQGDG